MARLIKKQRKSVHLRKELHDQLKQRSVVEGTTIERLVDSILVSDMKIYKKYNKRVIK